MFFHVVLAIVIVFLVVVQKGKGSAIGAAFGAGSAGSVFGARGATSFMQKVTYGLAFLFFASSIVLSYFSTNKTQEVQPIEQLLFPSTDLPALDDNVGSSQSADTPAAPVKEQ